MNKIALQIIRAVAFGLSNYGAVQLANTAGDTGNQELIGFSWVLAIASIYFLIELIKNWGSEN